MVLLTPKPGLPWGLSAFNIGASDLCSGFCFLLDILHGLEFLLPGPWGLPSPSTNWIGQPRSNTASSVGAHILGSHYSQGTGGSPLSCPVRSSGEATWDCQDMCSAGIRAPWCLPATILVLSVQVLHSQSWHYWHFGLDNSYCWEMSYISEDILATSLVSTHEMPVAPSSK